MGGLGLHYFYTEKTLKGILSMLFCWTGIPEVTGFIVGTMALMKKDDGNGNIMV